MGKYILICAIAFLIFCSGCKQNDNIILKRNCDRERNRILYFVLNNIKTDSIKFADWYCNAKIEKFEVNKWICIFNSGGGSGISVKNQFIISIKERKILKNLHIESFNKEGVLGDKTFKKNFIRKTEIIKQSDKNYIELKRTCLKNDIEYFSKIEKLKFDMVDNIYFNRSFNFENNVYKGVKIDSTEYIYYRHKWYEYDDMIHKLYQEL